MQDEEGVHMGVEGMAREKALGSRDRTGRGGPSQGTVAREYQSPSEARRISKLLLPSGH